MHPPTTPHAVQIVVTPPPQPTKMAPASPNDCRHCSKDTAPPSEASTVKPAAEKPETPAEAEQAHPTRVAPLKSNIQRKPSSKPANNALTSALVLLAEAEQWKAFDIIFAARYGFDVTTVSRSVHKHIAPKPAKSATGNASDASTGLKVSFKVDKPERDNFAPGSGDKRGEAMEQERYDNLEKQIQQLAAQQAQTNERLDSMAGKNIDKEPLTLSEAIMLHAYRARVRNSV